MILGETELYCRKCLYPLALLEAPRCPECGQPFDPENPGTYRRKARATFVYALRIATACLLIVGALSGALVVLVFEAVFAVSEHGLYLPVLISAAAVIATLAAWIGGSRWFAAPLIVLVLPLALLSVIAITPVKPFVQARNAVQPGMTPDEVRSVVAQKFRANGRFRQPVECQYAGYISPNQTAESSSICFVLDPNRYGAALLIVEFEDDRAVQATYYGD